MKKTHGFTLVEALLIVVVLGILGFVGYKVYDANVGSKERERIARTNFEARDSKTDRSKQIIEAYRKTLASAFNVEERAFDEGDAPAGKGTLFLRNARPGQPAAYAYGKPDGYNFFTKAEKGVHLTVSAESSQTGSVEDSDIVKSRQAAIAVMERSGLAKDASSSGIATDTYKNGGTTCQIDVFSKLNNAPDMNIDCSSAGDIEQAARKVKPLAEALFKEDGRLGKGKDIFSTIKIEDSKQEGYKRASVAVGSVDYFGGGMHYYYQKEGDAWKHLSAGQGAIGCGVFTDNADAKAAYKGEKCFTDVQGSGTIL